MGMSTLALEVYGTGRMLFKPEIIAVLKEIIKYCLLKNKSPNVSVK